MVVSINLWGINPYALARSSQSTARFPFPYCASWISWVTTLVCSQHPGIPGMPPFWTDVSMYLFFRRKSVILLPRMLKKILLSTLRSEMDWHRSSLVEFSSLGIQTLLRHYSEELWAALVYIVRYSTGFRSRAAAAATSSWPSFQVDSEVLNSTRGDGTSRKALCGPSSCSLFWSHGNAGRDLSPTLSNQGTCCASALAAASWRQKGQLTYRPEDFNSTYFNSYIF